MAENNNLEGYVKVAHVSEVPEKKGLGVRIGNRPIALFREDGNFYAVKNICPHLGSALDRGFLLGNKIIACADHGWTFNLENGESPDREDCRVPCYDVRVVGEDIYVSRSYRR